MPTGLAVIPPTATVANTADFEDEEEVAPETSFAALRDRQLKARSSLEQAFKLGEERLLNARGPSEFERRLAISEELSKPLMAPGAGSTLGALASALRKYEQGGRESDEALAEKRATFALDKAKSLAGSDAEYDKLIAQYMNRQATAGKPQRLPITTNANNQRILTEVYPDGRTVETNLDTSEKRVIGEKNAAPQGGANTFEVFPGISAKVGDVIAGPDNKSYRVLEGGETKEVAGAPKGRWVAATPQEAAIAGYAGPGTYNPETGEFKPNPGTPAILDAKRARAGLEVSQSALGGVVDNIKKVLPKITSGTTGLIGSAQSVIPGSPAFDVKVALESITGNIAKDELARIRAMSKNGASGFGSLTERELTLLENSIAAIKQGMSAPELKASLEKVVKHYTELQRLMAEDSNRIRTAEAIAEKALRSGAKPSEPTRKRFNPETGKLE